MLVFPAQIKAMKSIAGGLRLDLAAFRELEAFAQLGTELDPDTQARLDRGYRMVELLKQAQYEPLPVAQQVLIIYAGTKGFLDKVPVNEVQQWESQFLQFVRSSKADLLAQITSEGALTDEVTAAVEAALTEFQGQYSGGS